MRRLRNGLHILHPSLFRNIGVLLLAFLLLLSNVACSPDGSSQTRGRLALDTVNDIGAENSSVSGTTPERHSDKLAGSAETIDANGIVQGKTPSGISYTVHGRDSFAADTAKVTLCAVGDQIASDDSLKLADGYAGGSGDGLYDFTPFYQEVAPFIQSYDVRFINQETVMAGNEGGYSYSGYPTFNSPDACAEAIAQVDFNLVNFATNHIFDMGLYGIQRSHEVWSRYPELMVAGSYPSQEARDTVHMIERNGITFAFLAYTYGDNYYGFDPANMPNSYNLCMFDKATMKIEIERAQEVADVVIVAMHWGSEYVNDPNSQQYEYAEYLADLDVDLVLGTHAHIMQPTRYITGETGNTIPVVFGLSDFISGWTITDTILSGIFTCDFTTDGPGQEIRIENLAWYPTIEWSDGGTTYVRLLQNMDADTINANTRTPDVYDDYTYITGKLNSIGMEIPVVM